MPRLTRSTCSLGCLYVACCAVVAVVGMDAVTASAQEDVVDVVADAQRKVVKIFGAGGPRRLEGYQSGFLISPEGHIVTAWSYVLDDQVAVILDDGTRYEADLLGADPQTEVAVLKLPHEGEPLPHFQLAQAVTVQPGERVFAFSNLYKVATGDEPVSVLHGQVSLLGRVAAKRGASQVPMVGDVYVLDAMTNNPGSAGGVVTDLTGRPVGMIGKEAKSELYNTWINYAVPMRDVARSALAILEGRLVARRGTQSPRAEDPLSLALLGIVLVPDVVARTPPYIDATRPGTPADQADLRPDDLIVLVNDTVVGSSRELRELLDTFERRDVVRLAVSRDGALVTVELRADDGQEPSR